MRSIGSAESNGWAGAGWARTDGITGVDLMPLAAFCARMGDHPPATPPARFRWSRVAWSTALISLIAGAPARPDPWQGGGPEPGPNPGYLTVREAMDRSAPKQPEPAVRAPAPADLKVAPSTAIGRAPAIEGPARVPASTASPARPTPAGVTALPVPGAAAADRGVSGPRVLSLAQAIELAWQAQPRFKSRLQAIEQAGRGRGVAGPAILPTSGESSGAIGATGQPDGTPPGDPSIWTGFEVAELRIQSAVLDLGRRSTGRDRTELAGGIAQLQASRARQAVALDVSLGYFRVQEAQALRRTAQEALHRIQVDLADTPTSKGDGVSEREAKLRGEARQAEARQAVRVAIEREWAAGAKLNLAVVGKRGGPVRVQEPTGMAEVSWSAAECLDRAARDRPEFRAARLCLGAMPAAAGRAGLDFGARAIGDRSPFQLAAASQAEPADPTFGSFVLEWRPVEGEGRATSPPAADPGLREAMALVEAMADEVAYQVDESYRRLVAGRLAIGDSRTAVDRARETYRLVRARASEGHASLAEVGDALASTTRVEAGYYRAIYSYLAAFSRLEYALGIIETAFTAAPAGATAGPGNAP